MSDFEANKSLNYLITTHSQPREDVASAVRQIEFEKHLENQLFSNWRLVSYATGLIPLSKKTSFVLGGFFL